jgi:hypothetical protein
MLIYAMPLALKAAFGGRHAIFLAWVNGNGCTKSASEPLEAGFSDMVIIDPVERLNVKSDPRIHRKCLKELAHQIRIEFADLAVMEGRTKNKERPTGYIQRHAR